MNILELGAIGELVCWIVPGTVSPWSPFRNSSEAGYSRACRFARS